MPQLNQLRQPRFHVGSGQANIADASGFSLPPTMGRETLSSKVKTCFELQIKPGFLAASLNCIGPGACLEMNPILET